MKTKYLLFALPLVALCACNKEGIETNENQNSVLTCTVDNTKVSLNADGSNYTFKWTGRTITDEFLKVTELLETGIHPTGAPHTASAERGDFTFNTWVFQNVKESEVSSTASFECMPDQRPAPDFTDGKTRFIAYPNHNSGNTILRIQVDGEGNALKYQARMRLYNEQDVSNHAENVGNMLISAAYFPMYTLVGPGYDTPDAVHFTPLTAIVRLRVTNNTDTPILCSKVLLSSSVHTETQSLAGMALLEWAPGAQPQIPATDWVAKRTESLPAEVILINRSNATKTIPAHGTKDFNIAIFGGHNYGTLTWKMLDDDENQIGSDITSNPGKVLESGKVYTKSATIN